MKVSLFDIENQITLSQEEEALALVRASREYTIQQPTEGHYQVRSEQPTYQADIHLLGEGQARVKCYCAVYKRNKECKHAIAAMYLLRDHLIHSRKLKSNFPGDAIDEALRKMSITELRTFVSGYARSHAGFKSELLANTIHRVKKPDYTSLLMELTPIDKYGNIKLNRNNLKTLRGIVSTLLKQANQLALEKTLPETFRILEPVISHLYKLIQKFPAYQSQLLVELKSALRLFETLSFQPMAPRLQQDVIKFAKELSAKDGYFPLNGGNPILRTIESFVLEKNARLEFFQLIEEKIQGDTSHREQWIALWLHWQRIWELKPRAKNLLAIVLPNLPAVFTLQLQEKDFEDYLFTLNLYWHELQRTTSFNQILLSGLRVAHQVADQAMIIKIAAALSEQFYDPIAFNILYEKDNRKAASILKEIEAKNTSSENIGLDLFQLEAYRLFNDTESMLEKLKALNDPELVMEYDTYLLPAQRSGLEVLYAQMAREIMDTYGGVLGRQKLNNIFNHLKAIDLYGPVAAKLKKQEIKMTDTRQDQAIKGFVFDLDGVLVDTAVHHFNSWRRIMEELGVEIADEDDHHTRGASRMESLEYLLQKYGVVLSQEEKERVAARKNEYYLVAIESITPDDLLPGTLAFLMGAHEIGLKLALGSASKNAKGVLKKLGIEDRFDAILDGNDAQQSKPDPEIFSKASAALGLEPNSVVVFEDAAKGVQAAIAAGCHVVGLGDPGTLNEADIVIPTLEAVTPQQIIEQLS